MSGWYSVPGPELRHEEHPTLRVLPGGLCLRVVVFDRNRRRCVDASRPAANLADAYELGLGLILTLDMEEDARREIAARQRDQKRGFTRDRENDRDVVRQIRTRLDDPTRIVQALGLAKGARRQAGGGLLILCPVHEERTPSCSVRVHGDGTIGCKCHGCQWSADVLGLVAVVHGLDARREFRTVLERAAELAGVSLERGAA